MIQPLIGEKALEYAYETYCSKYNNGGCPCDYNPSSSAKIYPYMVVENEWKRMRLYELDSYQNSLTQTAFETQNWQITKSETKYLNSDGSEKVFSTTKNYLWDNYGHFLLTRKYGSNTTNKITIRQYIAPMQQTSGSDTENGTRNLRNREEFEATFEVSQFSDPSSFMLPPQDCEDCNEDPPTQDWSISADLNTMVTGGISRFLNLRSDPLGCTPKAYKRIAISNLSSSCTLKKSVLSDGAVWW